MSPHVISANDFTHESRELPATFSKALCCHFMHEHFSNENNRRFVTIARKAFTREAPSLCFLSFAYLDFFLLGHRNKAPYITIQVYSYSWVETGTSSRSRLVQGIFQNDKDLLHKPRFRTRSSPCP